MNCLDLTCSREEFSAEGQARDGEFPQSTEKIKKLDRRKARVLQGMSPDPDILTERKIGLSYEPMPQIRTRAELKSWRREKNSSFCWDYDGSRHDSPEVRLLKREEKYRVSSENSDTLQKLIMRRKYENIEYNSKTFGKVRIGIHHEELPSFSKYKKENWGDKSSILENNTIKSNDFSTTRHKRVSSTFEKELTKKPNETVPKMEENRNSPGCGRRFILSKLETLVLKQFKNFQDPEDKPQKVYKRKLKEKREILTPQLQIKHIRSGGFCVNNKKLLYEY